MRWLVWARRAVQSVCLLLFAYFFLRTAHHAVNRAGAHINLFYQLDPLAMAAVWLGSHAVAAGMLLSLATLTITLLFGRWFCGWICPFGALHNFFTSLRRRGKKDRLASGAYSRWHRLKYYVLAAFLCGALLGVNVTGWLDPIAFLFRGLATAVYPALNDTVAGLFGWVYNVNPGIGALRMTAATEPVYEFLRLHVLPLYQPHYFGNFVIGFLLVAALALNFFRARFWCRYVCPLGALLGVVGKNPLVRLRTSPDACNHCRICLADCQGGARNADGAGWKPAECLYCFNCVTECPTQAVAVKWGGPPGLPVRMDPEPTTARLRGGLRARIAAWLASFARPEKPARLELGRRQLLAAGLAGAGFALLARTHPLGMRRSYNPDLVRPPGSRAEDDFLARCIRCGECMKACPTNGIHPAAFEAGPAGVWTPVMKMTIGYCEYECTLCSQACPTGAIRPISVAEKQQVRIGLAYIDRNRCLPYAYARTCIVCEEHCPTPKKAIWLDEVEVARPDGSRLLVKQPRVDPELCIGCGICVNKCVIQGQPAILVSSAGESRNPGNGVLLG